MLQRVQRSMELPAAAVERRRARRPPRPTSWVSLTAGRTFWVVPHTRWDREWYLPFEQFRIYLVQTVDEVLDVLERDDRMRFTLDGQTVLLEDYLEVRPENESRLDALVRAGRIEIGPSYQFPDEYLVGQESLVRNLLVGRRACKRYGARSRPATRPTRSGTSHSFRSSSVASASTTSSSRAGWATRPNVGAAFRWRGFDGSELLAVRQLNNYANGLWLDAERVRAFWDRFGRFYEQIGSNDVLLWQRTTMRRSRPTSPGSARALRRGAFWGRGFGFSTVLRLRRRDAPARAVAASRGSHEGSCAAGANGPCCGDQLGAGCTSSSGTRNRADAALGRGTRVARGAGRP